MIMNLTVWLLLCGMTCRCNSLAKDSRFIRRHNIKVGNDSSVERTKYVRVDYRYLRCSQFWEKYSTQQPSWSKTISCESQSQYNAWECFGCSECGQDATHLFGHSWNSSEKVDSMFVSKCIVEVVAKKRNLLEWLVAHSARQIRL